MMPIVVAPSLASRRMQHLIRQLLAEGKGQRDLERWWGVNQSNISDWLSGKRNASSRSVERVVRRMRIRPAFFLDARFGEEPNYHDFLGAGSDDELATDEPHEFAEWERTVAPLLTPPLQPHERRQLVAVRFHRGAHEKYSRLLRDLREGLSAEDILAEEAETSAAVEAAEALGVTPRRGRS